MIRRALYALIVAAALLVVSAAWVGAVQAGEPGSCDPCTRSGCQRCCDTLCVDAGYGTASTGLAYHIEAHGNGHTTDVCYCDGCDFLWGLLYTVGDDTQDAYACVDDERVLGEPPLEQVMP